MTLKVLRFGYPLPLPLPYIMHFLKKLEEFINSPQHAKTPATGSSSSVGGTASIHQQRGFIIMSFGSGIHTPDVPLWAYKKLLEAISRFPELNFVVKFQKGENPTLDSLFNSHANILTMDWIPQTLLLGMHCI